MIPVTDRTLWVITGAMTSPPADSLLEEIRLPDEAATVALAGRLARLAVLGDVIALKGDLGAGKTALARAFIRALWAAADGAPAEEIPSPTFTLVQVYDCQPATVWHFDLYRIKDPEEVYELGFEEALSGGIALIEWPERLGRLLPRHRLEVVLEQLPDGPRLRRARLYGDAAWQARLSGDRRQAGSG